MKENRKDTGNHLDDDGIIDDDTKGNGMEGDKDFDVFHNNEDVTSEADEAYMDTLNDLTGSGNNVT